MQMLHYKAEVIKNNHLEVYSQMCSGTDAVCKDYFLYKNTKVLISTNRWGDPLPKNATRVFISTGSAIICSAA